MTFTDEACNVTSHTVAKITNSNLSHRCLQLALKRLVADPLARGQVIPREYGRVSGAVLVSMPSICTNTPGSTRPNSFLTRGLLNC